MKTILIGDPHAKMSTMGDLSKVIDFAISSKTEEDTVILLGDLFDTHGVVRNEISYFWNEQLEKLISAFEKVVCVVGNHDQVGSLQKEHIHSLWPFKKKHEKLIIVDSPMVVSSCLFVPYTADEQKFKNWILSSDKKVVFCHQTFDGAAYDNGMFAPDGFSLAGLEDKIFISGHIHSQSEFANVWYPGTALWESASDANKKKGIWKCHIAKDKVIAKEFISTHETVPEMISIEVQEDSEVFKPIEGKKYLIHLKGTSGWISKMKKALSGHKIKTTFTDSAIKKAQTKNLALSIEDFVKKQKYDSNPEDILKYIGGL